MQHGLLRPSFIPSRAQRELRDLIRTRTSLIDERSAAVNRIQKVLEDAKIKLAGVATDIMGASGRDILAALLDGAADAAVMADLARGKLRRKREALEQALDGRMSDHRRRVIALHLEHIDMLDEQIAHLSAAEDPIVARAGALQLSPPCELGPPRRLADHIVPC